jgi:sugar phosphate isomerase/epimerase
MGGDRMITLSCHTSSFSKLSLDDALGTAARLGFRYVDLAHIDPVRAAAKPAAEAAAIRALLIEFNLTVADVYLALPNFNAPDAEARESELIRFEALLPFVRDLGAPGITIGAIGVHPDGLEHSMARAVAGLLRMSRAAAAARLRLSIEPSVESVAELPADALRLLDCAPGLRLTLDYGSLTFQGVGRKDIVPLLGRTAHIQIRQAAKNRLQTSFELGKLELRDVVTDLHEAGYNGAVAVEYLDAPGEYGAMPVDVIEETVKTRDALRNARRAVMG